MNIENIKLKLKCLEPNDINGTSTWIMYIRLDAQKNEITRISIYDEEEEIFLLKNLPSRVIDMTFAHTTIEGLEINDKLNVWNTDYSQFGIRLNRDAMGRLGIITSWLKEKNVTFVFMVEKEIK